MAPMAVMFGGCGIRRVAAAARIMATSVQKRGLNIGSLPMGCVKIPDIKSDGWQGTRAGFVFLPRVACRSKIDIVPVVAGDDLADFDCDGPLENRPVINKRVVLAV